MRFKEIANELRSIEFFDRKYRGNLKTPEGNIRVGSGLELSPKKIKEIHVTEDAALFIMRDGAILINYYGKAEVEHFTIEERDILQKIMKKIDKSEKLTKSEAKFTEKSEVLDDFICDMIEITESSKEMGYYE